MQDTFDNLYRQSKQGSNFTKLMNIIKSDENILLAYRNLSKNNGSYTPGVDGKTIRNLSKLSNNELIALVHKKLNHYKSSPVKRVYIPKANGKMRPLGIPNIIDRLIQQCILQVMEPIAEARFYKSNYGFRPLRSAENAIADCYKKINLQKLHFVVDCDIKSFFDNVNHNKLIKQLWNIGFRDKQLICIIKEMLRGDIKEPDGTIIKPMKGTPQGGILSPLLANIVLNELDWWVASQWEEIPTKHQYQGYLHHNGIRSKNPKYNALRLNSNLKEVYIVRYADDFKIFCKDYNTAKKMLIATKDWIETRLKLQIAPDKSGITNLRKKYTDFLGFEIKVKRKGETHVVKSRIRRKAVKSIRDKLKNHLIIMAKSSGNQRKAMIGQYNSMIMGIHNYYRIATDVANDFAIIGRSIKTVLKHRNPYNIQIKSEGDLSTVPEKYRDSKQMRFWGDKYILPISYIRNSPPMLHKQEACKYTKEGRSIIPNSYKHNLPKLIRNYIPYRSAEYNMNRISKYSAQKGKCIILKQTLHIDDIHCHHIKPISQGGEDDYNNLVIIHKDIHKLIHSSKNETVTSLVNLYKLNRKQIEKINMYREKVGLEKI